MPNLTGAKLHIHDVLDNLGRWLPTAEIADTAGYSLSYTGRMLAELREQGMVVSRRDPAHTGRGAANVLWRLV